MGVYNIDTGDRRGNERQERSVEFFCYINGQRFDSTTFDISAGGVFLRTDHALDVGVTAIVAPKGERDRVTTQGNAPAVDIGAVLVGLVVRKQEEPVRGVGIQWVRCVSRNGIQAVFDLLAFYLGLFPASLPMPMPSVAAADSVAYDFQRKRFYIPKILSRAARSKEQDEAKRALAEAAKSVVEQMTRGPQKKKEEEPSPTLASLLRPNAGAPFEDDEQTRPYVAELEMESVLVEESEAGPPAPALDPESDFDAFPTVPEMPAFKLEDLPDDDPLGLKTVPEMPVVRIPESSPSEVMEAPEYLQDEWTGPVTSVIDRKDSWVPITVGVEFFGGGEVRQGTVRFIGVDGLYLLSRRVPGDIEGKVIITYPIPVEGTMTVIYLICSVGRIDRIVEGGLSGIELEICCVRKEPVPGLFKRYVKYLYFRMLSEEE
ncbi:MAG: PilZ domain-containing protein [Pseudomonadota bacterium]